MAIVVFLFDLLAKCINAFPLQCRLTYFTNELEIYQDELGNYEINGYKFRVVKPVFFYRMPLIFSPVTFNYNNISGSSVKINILKINIDMLRLQRVSV